MENLFSGLKVLDFTMNTAGPYGTAMLADYGADVLKVERPKVGDDQRNYSPQLDGIAVGFYWPNRGKRSLVVDLRDPDGLAIVKELAKEADVVVESFKPGTMAKFGLAYEDIKAVNPRVVYCSVSAYGQTGPMSAKPGYDMIAQALSGVMDLTGEPDGPPTRIGVVLADEVAGAFAFGSISAALFHRERSGEGQYIDVALLDSVIALNPYVEHTAAGNAVRRSGNNPKTLAPFGVFQGKDDFAIICAPNPKQWQALCGVMNRPDMVEDPRFESNGARTSHLDEMVAEIEGWLATFDDIDVAIELMDSAGIPVAKINTTGDLFDFDQVLARDMIIETTTPAGTPIKTKGTPVRFSAVEPVRGRAPALGENEVEVLTALGYSEEKIAELVERWQVGA